MITISGKSLTMTVERFQELLQDGSDTWKVFRNRMFVTVWNTQTEQTYQGVYLGIDSKVVKLNEVESQYV